MARMTFVTSACALMAVSTPSWTQQTDQLPSGDAYQRMQANFANAYNRGDTAAMAAYFAEDGIRVTPNGILRGHDAIRQDFQKAIDMGLHDYKVVRTVSRPEGNLVFNAGEWQAKLGDHPFRGYYSAIVTTEGGEVKILEETVNIATPRQ